MKLYFRVLSWIAWRTIISAPAGEAVDDDGQLLVVAAHLAGVCRDFVFLFRQPEKFGQALTAGIVGQVDDALLRQQRAEDGEKRGEELFPKENLRADEGVEARRWLRR